MNILIIGGYGIFGGRLAHLLAQHSSLTLIIAGRSLDKATTFIQKNFPKSHYIASTFDRNAHIIPQLRQHKIDLVIDASGPFQSYGDDHYRLVKACLQEKIHYMDFSDASNFVSGISQFDSAAKAANRFVLSGVSSFPILTAAVVRRLSTDIATIDSIKGGIAPSPFAIVGLNVIGAITSYAGKPVKLKSNGEFTTGVGMLDNCRYTISPPGYKPLNNIRFSLVDVPDLQVLPLLWPEVKSVWMGAGPTPEILHRMLNGLAYLVKIKWIPSLTPFAPLFHFVLNILRWGEHRGGMFVEVEGTNHSGKKVTRSWHLVAEGEDGPFIPAMALEAIVIRCLKNNAPASGARPGSVDLELDDYESLFSTRQIFTGTRESSA